MKVKLKVCGMREAGNIVAVGALQPDYMGFIFYERSRRFVENDFSIPAGLAPNIKRVGVFVNEKIDQMLTQVFRLTLDYVQLHGDEVPEVCKVLKENGIGVIKAFSVDGAFDFSRTRPYGAWADFFLFDTKSENYGGTGKSFDWNLLKMYDQKIPFFLSGGLSPDNIENVKALKGMNLHAADVNSGVEQAPGMKDVGKIRQLKDLLTNIY